jgi:release factor glutamine methyltransferase
MRALSQSPPERADGAIAGEIGDFDRLCRSLAGTKVRVAGLAIECTRGVLPPTNAVTRAFAAVVAEERGQRVLDLGCGSGVLGLVACGYARQVIGVDTNPLAVANARRNAALNRIENARFVLGSGFQPVLRRRFDLIVCNPPFYPLAAPSDDLSAICCDAASSLLTAMIVHLEDALSPGGRALFVTSSLSDNDAVSALLSRCGLLWLRRLLRRGKAGSQDIFLWEARPMRAKEA